MRSGFSNEKWNTVKDESMIFIKYGFAISLWISILLFFFTKAF